MRSVLEMNVIVTRQQHIVKNCAPRKNIWESNFWLGNGPCTRGEIREWLRYHPLTKGAVRKFCTITNIDESVHVKFDAIINNGVRDWVDYKVF